MPQLNIISLALWGMVGIGIAVALALLIRAERTWFRQRGKALPWLVVRLGSLPVMGITVLLAMQSNRSIGGAEPLLVFLISLVTAVPLVYFGGHWLIGKTTSPRLHGGESAWIAFSGLMMIAGPATLISVLNPYIHSAAGTGMARGFPELPADPAPAPQQIVAAQRFNMPALPVMQAEHWQFPPGVEVVRLDTEFAGQFLPVSPETSSHLCRRGSDLHLFAPAGNSTRWRLYWKTANGPLRRSDWSMVPAPETPAAFEPIWAADHLRLPAVLPAVSVQFFRTGINGVQSVAEPRRPAAPDTCLPQELVLDDTAPGGPITELVLHGRALADGNLWRESFRRGN